MLTTKKDDYERAIADYNRTIEFNPNYAETYYNRGLVYDIKGEINRAIVDYNRAIELNPQLC